MQRSPRTIMVLAAALAVSTVAFAEQSKQQGGPKTAARVVGSEEPTISTEHGFVISTSVLLLDLLIRVGFSLRVIKRRLPVGVSLPAGTVVAPGDTVRVTVAR